MKKLKLVISDFHLSRGKWLPDGRRNPLEDFHEDQKLREFLEHYSSGDYETADVELIINGDFFDPLAVIPLPGPRQKKVKVDYPHEVEEPAAIAKIKMIAEAHQVSMDGLRLFLSRGKKVIIRWGNHDPIILWPRVQQYLVELLQPPQPGLLVFLKEKYIFDRICIDHGHQYEVLNQFDEENIFIERKMLDGSTKKIQNLPFGSFFVLGFFNHIKLNRSYINQVQPFRTYLRLAAIFDPIFFITGGLKVAWFFIKMRFVTHPMRFARLRKTLLILLEVFKRTSLEHEVENIFADAISHNRDLGYDTVILGHNHQAAFRVFPGGKTYVNTGTWTPITSLHMSTLGHKVLRTYALIEYVEGKARISLKVWNGKPQIAEDFK